MVLSVITFNLVVEINELKKISGLEEINILKCNEADDMMYIVTYSTYYTIMIAFFLGCKL